MVVSLVLAASAVIVVVAGIVWSLRRRDVRPAALAVLAAACIVGFLLFVRTGDPFVLVAGVAVATTLLVLLAAADVLLRKDLAGVQRLAWLVIVVFVNPILPVGAGAYLLMGPDRTRDLFRDVGTAAAPTTPPSRP